MFTFVFLGFVLFFFALKFKLHVALNSQWQKEGSEATLIVIIKKKKPQRQLLFAEIGRLELFEITENFQVLLDIRTKTRQDCQNPPKLSEKQKTHFLSYFKAKYTKAAPELCSTVS